MDLISNFAGGISASQFGGKAKELTANVDLNDKTFFDLLEKQLLNNTKEQDINIMDNLGIPAGFDIGIIDGLQSPVLNNDIDKLQTINSVQNTNDPNLSDLNGKKAFSTSEILAFFPSLFETKPTLTDVSKSGLFDFERKVATSSYGKYARNIVTDLNEFVTDTMKLR